MSYINFNGKFLPVGTAVVGSENRGLRYGDGLFETMKISAEKLVFEQDHFDRLWHGLKVLGFHLSTHFTKEQLIEAVKSLCQKNQHAANGRVRLNIFRGGGGLYDATNHAPNYVIESWELPEGATGFNSNGLVLGIYPHARKACDILSNLKHNNYLPYVMAALYAKQEKWNDALLLNSAGHICDSTIANVFLVREGEVITPGLQEGCVAGVMRGRLISYLAAEGFKVREQTVSIEEVLAADEVFLTNSIYNIRWVQRLGDRNYGSDVTRKIYAGFLPTIS